MSDADPKADLHRYRQTARKAMLWKLDGLSEYDVRRPLTPAGATLPERRPHTVHLVSGVADPGGGEPDSDRRAERSGARPGRGPG